MKTLSDKIWVYFECNNCNIMFPHLKVPRSCTCGNDLDVSSTKKRVVLTFHIKEFIEDLKYPEPDLELNVKNLHKKIDELAGDKLI